MGIRVDEWKYVQVKETPKGYWITLHVNEGRDFSQLRKWELHWIRKYAKKKFAYPTREQAWTNYQLRKLRQIKILETQLANARAAYGCQQPKINEKSVGNFDVF